MIEELIFTNLLGDSFEFNTDTTPLHEFNTEVDVRTHDQDRPQEHGIWPDYTWLGKRLYHLQGELLKDTSEQYIAERLAMIKALMPRPGSKVEKHIGTLKLWLSGEAARMVANCTLDGWPELPMVAGAPARGAYAVNFKSFDPRLFSETLNSQNYAFNAETSIVNLGNIDSFPTIIFNGPVVNPYAQVSRTWGSQIITLNATLTTGQYVVLSIADRTATDYAAANRYNEITGDWWSVESGTQLVKFGGTSGTGTMQIQWKSAWMI